nr:hypothetical protein [Hymenobacter crusticola]
MTKKPAAENQRRAFSLYNLGYLLPQHYRKNQRRNNGGVRFDDKLGRVLS